MEETIQTKQYVQRLIRQLENHLDADIKAEFLSSSSYVSRSQLYRDFYSITGHSVKEYIRKRRLSNALLLIKTSEFTLAEIAYQCGFSSQQALCRAVKQSLGITPLAYKESEMFYFFPPYSGVPLQSVNIKNENIPACICFQYYDTCRNHIEERAIKTILKAMPEYCGRIFGRDGKQRGSFFCYEVMIEDMQTGYFPLLAHGFRFKKEEDSFSILAASTVVKNQEESINDAWEYLYAGWLQGSMYQPAKTPYFEEYLIKNGRMEKLRLFLPVQRRKDNIRILWKRDPDLRFLVAKADGPYAEQAASQTIVQFLSSFYPEVLQKATRFFLSRQCATCVCGVGLDYGIFCERKESSVQIFTVEKGDYLVLESPVMGNYDRYAEQLVHFAQESGMIPNSNAVFAVYNTDESSINPSLQMFCPVYD